MMHDEKAIRRNVRVGGDNAGSGRCTSNCARIGDAEGVAVLRAPLEVRSSGRHEVFLASTPLHFFSPNATATSWNSGFPKFWFILKSKIVSCF